MYGYGYAYPMAVDNRESIPTSIPDLGLWLKSDAGVTLVGGAVDVWADQSGNGRNFSAPGAGNRPAYGTLIAGKPVLTFDGTDDYLLGNASSLSLAQNVGGLSAFVVFRQSVAATFRLFNISTPTVGNTRFITGGDGTQLIINARREDMASVAALAGGTQPTTLQMGAFLARYSAGTGAIFQNSASVVDSALTSAGNTADTASGRLTIGNGLNLANHMTGNVCEIVVYRRTLTPAERNTITAYLMNRWEIV
jgi:hypothetical protein